MFFHKFLKVHSKSLSKTSQKVACSTSSTLSLYVSVRFSNCKSRLYILQIIFFVAWLNPILDMEIFLFLQTLLLSFLLFFLFITSHTRNFEYKPDLWHFRVAFILNGSTILDDQLSLWSGLVVITFFWYIQIYIHLVLIDISKQEIHVFVIMRWWFSGNTKGWFFRASVSFFAGTRWLFLKSKYLKSNSRYRKNYELKIRNSHDLLKKKN